MMEFDRPRFRSDMSLPLLLGSFPSNELHTPLLPVALAAGVALIGVLYVLLRLRMVSVGLIVGAVCFACMAALLFWPRELREPRVLNPGPGVAFVGAVLGGVLGSVAALLGKLIQRLRRELPSASRDEARGDG
jgi:hypothetical protein